MNMKKESWTEEEILLISSESENFERKAGALLDDGKFDEKIAKQLSAFSNADGGYVVLGVCNDGSFDGLPLKIKNTDIYDWLGQKIHSLVTPNLNSAWVRKVERSNDSLIPEGRVLAVIEIGKSELAPHQSLKDLHYYYRFGTESRPAPHRLVELLFNRIRFPGPRVASMWLHSVINPLINGLRREKDLLEKQKWHYDMHGGGKLGCTVMLGQSLQTANAEQFFLNYEGYAILIAEHDNKAESLFEQVRQGHEAMSNYFAEHFYDNVTKLETLERLRNGKYTDSYKFAGFKDRVEYINALFSSLDPKANSRILTQCIINGGHNGLDYSFKSFWDLMEEHFLNERRTTFSEEMTKITSAANTLMLLSANLLEKLENERIDLCQKNLLPFEEPLNDARSSISGFKLFP